MEPALAAIARARPGALVVLPAPISVANAERIRELAIRLRIPSITAAKALMERGLLMSYGWNTRDVERRIPSYVDRRFGYLAGSVAHRRRCEGGVVSAS